jgi:hypothetical protein
MEELALFRNILKTLCWSIRENLTLEYMECWLAYMVKLKVTSMKMVILGLAQKNLA